MAAAVAWWSVAAGRQMSSEQAVGDLASPDGNVRLRGAERLKEAAPPEAAVPLAALVTDPRDDVQFAAIAAEVNIFLADKIVPRKRVGLVIEVRNKIAAMAALGAMRYERAIQALTDLFQHYGSTQSSPSTQRSSWHHNLYHGGHGQTNGGHGETFEEKLLVKP